MNLFTAPGYIFVSYSGSIREVRGGCRVKHPSFEMGCYGFYFEGRLREAFLSFKFRNRRDASGRLIHFRYGAEAVCEKLVVIMLLPVT